MVADRPHRPGCLLLPGYACRSWIWRDVVPNLESIIAVDQVDWPTGLTPGFHTLGDFAEWLSGTREIGSYEFIVGHSMGGRVALKLASSRANSISKIILVESFLTSPRPFFQNLLMPDCPDPKAAPILSMLKAESVHYSDQLRESLRHADLTDDLVSITAAVHAIHGDRGSADPSKVISELNWSESLRERIGVSVVAGACHFPMIEQPEALAEILRGLLT